MREKKQIILIMLILISIIGIACPQERDHSSHKVSELNLTVNLDKNEIHLNQGIKVDFIIKNKEKENDQKAYAKDVYLSASLSKSLAGPKEKLRIESNGTAGSIGTDGEVEISSDFNRHHPDSGDWAEIRPDRLISIHFPDLDPGEKIGIRYKTKYIKNLCQDPQPICYIPEKAFNWSIAKQNIQGPFIPKIKGLNYKPIIESFNVSIKPEYNITYPNAPNCTIFEHSQIFFANKTYDQDDEKNDGTDVIVNYFDDKINPYSPQIRINSGDYIDDSGIHQFQMKANDSIDSNPINNSTYFRVINIGEYHKQLIYSLKFIFYLVLSLLVPLLIIGAMRYFKKCKDKIYIGLLLFGIILAYVFYIIYYIFLCRYYQDTVILESITLSIAYLVLLFYYLCIDKEPKELPKQKFRVKKIDNVSTKKRNDEETVFLEVDGEICIGKRENEELSQKYNPIIPIVQIILMGLFTIFFHYYLLEILSNSHAYLFLSALGLAICTFILAMKKPICKFIECAGPEKDSLIRIGFSILAFAYIILIPIYYIKNLGVAFSPKLGLLEIIIIICSELMPLLTVAITGMTAETAWDFMTRVFGNANES